MYDFIVAITAAAVELLARAACIMVIAGSLPWPEAHVGYWTAVAVTAIASFATGTTNGSS